MFLAFLQINELISRLRRERLRDRYFLGFIDFCAAVLDFCGRLGRFSRQVAVALIIEEIFVRLILMGRADGLGLRGDCMDLVLL